MAPLQAFWSRCDATRTPAIDARLDDFVAAARSLELPADAMLAYLASRWDGTAIDDFLDGVDADELALAFGCVQGDPRALERFDREYMSEVRVGASRLRCDAAELDDIAQEVRRMLLAPTATGAPKLESMTARGDLRALIRLMALRAGISLRRKSGREIPVDDAAFELAGDDATPSIVFAKEQHRALFARALEESLAKLDTRTRSALKLHCLDGVALAKLADMYNVDRSTVTRWIAKARQQVMAETRRRLATEAGISPERFESFLDVIRSNFAVSLRRMLAG